MTDSKGNATDNIYYRIVLKVFDSNCFKMDTYRQSSEFIENNYFGFSRKSVGVVTFCGVNR